MDTEENEEHAGMLAELAILELHKRPEKNILIVVITSDIP